MLKANDEIGPYTLIKQLGIGAFGIVWLAEKRTEIATSQVALKIALEEQPDLDGIKQEANLWSQIGGHPNVLPMIEANIYDGQIVIVSEYAPDGSLESWLKNNQGKAPSIEQAVNLTLGILSGLEHLHSKKVLHRDLKPANILLQGETPRLADFGLSRILKTTVQSTKGAGTPVYMSPEAFDGKKVIPTDLWAVGIIFYQLLTGQFPFPIKEYSALVGAILTKEPRSLPLPLSKQFQQTISKALEKDPSKRYQTATEMKLAIKNAWQGIPDNPIKPKGKATTVFIVTTVLVALLVVVAIKFGNSPTPIASNSPTPIVSSSPTPIASSSPTPIASSSPTPVITSRPTPTLITQTTTQLFEFETVKVDAKGKIIERAKKSANQFIEDLGNGIKLEMVEIPSGTFTMGSPSSEAERSNDEGPQHQVTVPTFYIGKVEITQGQWQKVMGNNPSYFKGNDDLPVENVTWNDAVEFCRKLSKKTDREYRLPSEAEWEYAARAGSTTPFAFGQTINPDIVNYNGKYPYGNAPIGVYRQKTTIVGSLSVANAFGLYDMHGNVWEWCQDIYQDSYNGAPKNGSAWEIQLSNNTYRVCVAVLGTTVLIAAVPLTVLGMRRATTMLAAGCELC